ncbi:cytochrome b/b6 domain-containing protein [Permianibacter aggregans]|nr:cytochrome b/b6 domain-containing protein [Permianibacter aggregans]
MIYIRLFQKTNKGLKRSFPLSKIEANSLQSTNASHLAVLDVRAPSSLIGQMTDGETWLLGHLPIESPRPNSYAQTTNHRGLFAMSTRVYDLPTRIFHGLFAISFLTAFAVANIWDDESLVFSYHMIAGLMMCFVLCWRIAWGFFGSRHARFSDFSLRPKELLAYVKGLFSDRSRTWPGHNPASSWAAMTMMILAGGLGITGYLMASGNGGESLGDVHEFLADLFIVVVLLHAAGVVLHMARHKDALAKSMFTGKKQQISADTAPVASHASVGVILFLLTIGFGGYLWQNFNTDTRVLTLFDTPLQLGEIESNYDETDDDEHHQDFD